MKQLLKKEFCFTANKLTYVFILFAALTMAPGYPILVGAFFLCMGIFYTFQSAREGNDALYSTLLPVKKSHVVKARFWFVVAVEAANFLLNAALTGVRMIFLADAAPYAENALMNANFVYLGWILLIFALFNRVFCCGFWKDAYSTGKPFILFSVFAFLLISLAEALHFFPGLEFLNATSADKMEIQIPFFLACVAVFALTTLLSCKKSMKNFEKIQL